MIIITTIITIIIKSRRRVSREIILQILFPRVRTSFLGKLGLVHRIRNQWNSRNIPDTRPSTNERTQISPPIPRLSLSRPGAEKDNRGCSLNGKKADKQRHKVAVHLRYRSMGMKNETIHGGGRWTVTIFPREYRTRIEKGALFHSSRFSQLREEFARRIFVELRAIVFFFPSFSFVGLLYGWRIESMRRIQFEDLILVGWWKQSKSESFF